MLVIYIALAFATAALTAGSQKYDNYAVILAYPKTFPQLEVVSNLGKTPDLTVDVWIVGGLTKPSHIFVGPDFKEALFKLLDSHQIKYEVANDNIQNALDNEKKPAPLRNRGASFPNSDKFTQFMPLSQLTAFVNQLAKEYPDLVKVDTIGTTHMNKSIILVKVGKHSEPNPNKPIIWLDGGIHAREWASTASVLFILNKLVTGYSTSAVIKKYVDKVNWYILPSLNPDGYEYTHTTERMWRKNRRPGPTACRPGGRCCDGVDLNRNFAFDFGGKGTSGNPCDETYRGSVAFSEPESRAVRDAVLKIKSNLKAFLTIHSFSQMWFFPFGNERNAYPDNADDLARVAMAGAEALKAVHGTEFEVGTPADLLYEAAGGSDDWSKGVAGIEYVFCLELRPGQYDYNGFVLPPRQIIAAGEETYAGLMVVADEIINKYGR